jgi:hypothetical protein
VVFRRRSAAQKWRSSTTARLWNSKSKSHTNFARTILPTSYRKVANWNSGPKTAEARGDVWADLPGSNVLNDFGVAVAQSSHHEYVWTSH